MLGAGAAALAGSMEPATTLAIGWAVLGEPVTGPAAAGVALVLAAQWLARPRRPANRGLCANRH